jgi:hypothetical protein
MSRPGKHAQLVARQAVAVAMAHLHAALAEAAVAGLSAHLDTAETRAWRQVTETARLLARGRRIVPRLTHGADPAA